ncbi:Cu(2+)-transporting P-type ATPase, partial [Coemansia sp. RSA 2703]
MSADISHKQTWSVTGMTCQSCVRSIESALADLHGLHSLTVSLDRNQADAVYDSATLPASAITQAIQDCGFEAAVVPGSLRLHVTLPVHGMTCQSCVKSITGVVGTMSGVDSVDVSLEKNQATIVWDPAVVGGAGAENIVEAIEGCGFEVPRPAEEAAPQQPGSAGGVMVAMVGVEGMTCQSCVRSVTSALEDTKGVMHAEVRLQPRGLACVRYDSDLVSAATLASAVEEAGFTATLESNEAEIQTGLADRAVDGDSIVAFAQSSSSDDQKVPLLLGEAGSVETSRTFRDDAPPSRGPAYSFSSTKSGDTLLDGSGGSSGGTTVQLEVHGMTCSSCVALIERTLKRQPGVLNVSVSLLAQRATVEYDAGMVSEASVVQWISELGFEAKALDATARVARLNLNVYGMTCASCVGAVERAVGRLEGVVSVSVSLALETAAIEYRPVQTGVRQLVAAVEAAGFDVLVGETTQNNTQLESLQRTRDIVAWRRRFWQSLWFSLPVIFIAK